MKSLESLQTDEACKKLFPLGSSYQSQHLLAAMLDTFAQTRGFSVSIQSSTKIACVQFGSHTKRPSKKSKSKLKDDYHIIPCQSSTMKCGCPFIIKNNRKSPTSIYFAHYSHGNGCVPSPDQLVAVRKKWLLQQRI